MTNPSMPLHLTASATSRTESPPAETPAETPAVTADVSLLGATAMGLVIAPRPDAPFVLARLAARSGAGLGEARAWVLETDVMPAATRESAAALLQRARAFVRVPVTPTA
jgi:hypothetical protein